MFLSKYECYIKVKGFPGGSDGKETACNAGDTKDMCLILWSGRSPGEVNGYPLQYSCLDNPMDKGICDSPCGHKELDTTEWVMTHKNYIKPRKKSFD